MRMTKSFARSTLLLQKFVHEYGVAIVNPHRSSGRARMARSNRREGEFGNFIFMVGPEANRFVFHTSSQHFSHDQGWTPIMGESLGHGLLDVDDPEHAVHRRMWNPAFTAVAMEAYVPIILRVIADRMRPLAGSAIVWMCMQRGPRDYV